MPHSKFLKDFTLQVLQKMTAYVEVACPHWSVHKTKVFTVHVNWNSYLFFWILQIYSCGIKETSVQACNIIDIFNVAVHISFVSGYSA